MPERTAALLLFGRSAVVLMAGERRQPRRRGFSCGKAAAGEQLRAAARARELVRVEACGAHACLPKLRASAAGGFGPPHLRATRIRAAACGGTQRADASSGSSRGRSCGPADPSRDRRCRNRPAAERRRHEPVGELQPSARGRLRAAALKRACPVGTKPAERPCQPMRASARRGCGPPHLHATRIRGAACETLATSLARVAGLRRAKLRPAALSRELIRVKASASCGPPMAVPSPPCIGPLPRPPFRPQKNPRTCFRHGEFSIPSTAHGSADKSVYRCSYSSEARMKQPTALPSFSARPTSLPHR